MGSHKPSPLPGETREWLRGASLWADWWRSCQTDVQAAIPAALSPDLNPIEQVFAKRKHLMRKAAERTHERRWRRVGDLANTL
ncbi:hypothetical protein SPHI_27850 [Sphingomonas jeddahensis]|uniref:Uncharacterized protein n=1 Tax=Sphingomonas jeddahensis TaxID=1915074 RepID=A0A1V2ER98_9SPHN|nr:hypothetical protein SPHI_27850 [Sphingomonas jeddahensis]